MTFCQLLDRHALTLVRDRITTLQINTGLRCDLTCRHCHLDAGPHRSETIDSATMAAILDLVRREAFSVIDITGGAPELVFGLAPFLRQLRPHCSTLYLRTNLSAITRPSDPDLLDICCELQVTLIGSLPAPDAGRTDAQRGSGVFTRSVETLQELNRRGYGQPGSGLDLFLVATPTGAFLAPSQKETEARYRTLLADRYGVAFTGLFAMSNAPLGRFRQWLESSGNLDAYCTRLADSFNPAALAAVMCRSQLCVDWQGFLYDCDFNLAVGLGLGGERQHIADLVLLPKPGETIAVADHCLVCTAGCGSSCGGAVA